MKIIIINNNKKYFNNNEDKDPDSGFEWKKKKQEM